MKKIFLNAGDTLVFDSRLWHGSIENINKISRYAFVTRWKIHDYHFPFIPKPKPLKFGMWNCHEQLKGILFEFNKIRNGDKVSFEDLLINTKNLLIAQRKINLEAITAIDNLKILHKASKLHDAGDLCGNIYKKFWCAIFDSRR